MTDMTITDTTSSPRLVAELTHMQAQRTGLVALQASPKLRDGLRYVAGVRGLFMPTPPTVDALAGYGLVEPSEGGVSVGMPDYYRPTGLGSELLPAIGVRG